MKRLTSFVCLFAVSLSTLALTACSVGGGNSFSYQNVTISLTPQPASIAAGTSVQFNTTVTNAPDAVVFSFPEGLSDPKAGTLTHPAGVGEGSVLYTAPAVPPIYTAAQVASGLVQGTVTLQAATYSKTGESFPDLVTSVKFVITGPISVGLSPATATVAINQTQQFTGYAVGSVNNAITWQVNGVTGGSTVFGTISSSGLYTAPSALPMTGAMVTITAVSQADTTKVATATIVLSST